MKLLKRLSEAFGGSGYEAEVAAIVAEELGGICRSVHTDTLGNVVGMKPGRGPKDGRRRIMLAAHMDEIGFLVSHVDDAGFLRVQPAGGFDPRTLIAQRVTVLGRGKKKIPGLLNPGGTPIHLQAEEDRKRDLKVSQFFVDLGMPAEKVKEQVEIGDRVIWNRDFAMLGDCVTGKALDDRVGVYTMIEAVRRVSKNRHDIYAVGTVQEEVGVRGATTSAYDVHPEIAIALDVTLAVDTPGIEAQDRVTQLGKGVAIKIMDSLSISDSGLVSEFRALAEAKKIPHQLEILPRGGTDAGGMQRVRGGSRAITLSIPIRYVHSVNECAHKRDIEATIDLLAAYLDR